MHAYVLVAELKQQPWSRLPWLCRRQVSQSVLGEGGCVLNGCGRAGEYWDR